jgi:hypothetical protein
MPQTRSITSERLSSVIQRMGICYWNLLSREQGWFALSVHDGRRRKNGRITKKMLTDKMEEEDGDELMAEYDFDYRRARPNRFVLEKQQRVVILEPEVAEYFQDSEAVNRVLKALIDNMPRAV